jgi:hypothetical protein
MTPTHPSAVAVLPALKNALRGLLHPSVKMTGMNNSTPKHVSNSFWERCASCGQTLVPIAYGMPSTGLMELAERGEVVLGGCTIMGDDPTHSCACGATTRVAGLDESAGDRCDDEAGFGSDEARVYIGSVRWQFAKTMPQWPHEYTVRGWRPELSDQFSAFAAFIRADGVVKPWPADSPSPRYHHTYLAIDGWEYWTMGEAIADTEVINRARIADA